MLFTVGVQFGDRLVEAFGADGRVSEIPSEEQVSLQLLDEPRRGSVWMFGEDIADVARTRVRKI